MREKYPIEKCGKIRTFHGDRIVYYKHIYVKEPHDYNMREFLDRRTVDRDMVRSNYNYLMYPMGVSIDKERFLEGTETFDSYVIMMNEWEDGVDNKTSYVGNYVSISYVSSTPLGKKEYLPILREYIIKHSLTLLGDIYTITIPLRSRNRVDAEYLSAIYCRIEEEITIEEE